MTESGYLEEAHETDNPRGQHLLYLAGVVEAGATVSFSRSRRSTARPIITVIEKHADVCQDLEKNFGGLVDHREGKTRWSLSDQDAAELLIELSPYLVTRQEYAVAAENWINSTEDERSEIAEEIQGFDRFAQGTEAQDYAALVENPHFVAGVMDTRGTAYERKAGKGQRRLHVEIGSLNKPMLEALQVRYGGIVQVRVEKGTKGVISGINFETKRTSYEWRLSDANAREFISEVHVALKNPPYEGWNYRSLAVEQSAIAGRTQNIISFMQNELELCKSGELFSPITSEKLAEKFGISEATLKRTFKEVPAEIRTQREQLLRKKLKRSLDDRQIKALVDEITDEVKKHMENPNFPLRFNREFGHKVDTMTNHVVPNLPEDIRNYRTSTLRRQAGQKNKSS